MNRDSEQDIGLLVTEIFESGSLDSSESSRMELKSALKDRLRVALIHWKNTGGISRNHVIYRLPASINVRESAEDYEMIIYGSASEILEEEGFLYVPAEFFWKYTGKKL